MRATPFCLRPSMLHGRALINLTIDANQTQHFNSHDLELCNVMKGIPQGVGTGSGDWRLEVVSALEVLAPFDREVPRGYPGQGIRNSVRLRLR